MGNPWIQTVSGQIFDLLDPPDPNPYDIAHALARICRFTGHTRQHYSVAQHSVLCVAQASPKAKLWALCHDAHEAYVGDVTAPLKRLLPDYQALEERIQAHVRLALVGDVPQAVLDEVHEIDLRMCLTEQRDLLGPQSKPWGVPGEPYDFEIQARSPGQAACEWIWLYGDLR